MKQNSCKNCLEYQKFNIKRCAYCEIDFRDNKNFRRNKCDKCSNKAILIIKNIEEIVSLCCDHTPRLSNGNPGYTKFTIIKGFHEPEPIILRDSNLKTCFVCDKKIENIDEFIHQKIIPELYDSPYIYPALPVKEIEYYVCSYGFGCSKYFNEDFDE
jgi:hypothetical protein